MQLVHYTENDLPLKDLETLGLASGGQLLLNVNDLQALLSGRRTNMLHLENLETEQIKIKAIDAKISLRPNANGKSELLIHPIYRKPATPYFLEDFEARELENGEVVNLLKEITDDKGNKTEVLVEYDAETREFIVSDTEKIMAPDMVNGEFLTAAQKENYRKGKEIEIPDRTKLSFTAANANGVRSNKLAFVASILVDGGLSYVVFKGLNALFNKKHDPKEAESLSPGYHKALQDMDDQQLTGFIKNLAKARPVIAR